MIPYLQPGTYFFVYWTQGLRSAEAQQVLFAIVLERDRRRAGF